MCVDGWQDALRKVLYIVKLFFRLATALFFVVGCWLGLLKGCFRCTSRPRPPPALRRFRRVGSVPITTTVCAVRLVTLLERVPLALVDREKLLPLAEQSRFFRAAVILLKAVSCPPHPLV